MLTATLLLCALYALLLVGKAAFALRYIDAPRPSAAATAPTTTILQPILGGDPALSDVLESNLRALPQCRFLWLVDTDDTLARDAADALRARYPQIAIDCLLLPPAPAGHNPKIHKLDLAARCVETPHLVVLDDDTHLPAASLGELLARLEHDDLATGLPCYLDDGRFASRLLAQFVNNNAALTYLPLLTAWPPASINGMGYALRTDALARMGGFAPLARHLTDDLAVALALRASGGSIHQSVAPLYVRTSVRGPRHYTQLLHRWFLFALLLLERQPRAMRVNIVLLQGLPPLLLGAACLSAAIGAQPFGAIALASVFVLRALVLRHLQRRLTGAQRHRALLSVFAELLQPLHALHALLQRRIRWRTRHYRVRANDDFEPVA
jgi:ceramide glucosyltransferase